MTIALLYILVVCGCHNADKYSVIYTLEKDSMTVMALQNDKVKWQVKVSDSCGLPAVGANKIRDFRIGENVSQIVYGKHSFAEIDKNSGKVNCLGAD